MKIVDGKILVSKLRIYVIYGNDKYGPYDKIGKLQFSPDGKTLAYRVKIDDKWYVISGNDKYGPYDYLEYLQFSPDGKNLAYKVKINK